MQTDKHDRYGHHHHQKDTAGLQRAPNFWNSSVCVCVCGMQESSSVQFVDLEGNHLALMRAIACAPILMAACLTACLLGCRSGGRLQVQLTATGSHSAADHRPHPSEAEKEREREREREKYLCLLPLLQMQQCSRSVSGLLFLLIYLQVTHTIIWYPRPVACRTVGKERERFVHTFSTQTSNTLASGKVQPYGKVPRDGLMQ